MSGSRLRILEPLSHRDFRLLVVGLLVSLAGNGFFIVAIGIQVLLVSNEPSALATVGLAWAGGQLAGLPVGGWASDRFERRKVMLLADLWRAAVMGAIGVLSFAGVLALWHLLILGALFGLGHGFFNPAASALLPDLVPDEDLAQANAFLGMARPTMYYIIGPLAGAAVVAVMGVGGAFLLDAVTFVFSAGMLALMTARPLERDESGGFQETLDEIRGGLAYVRGERWLWRWILGAAVGTLAFAGPFEVWVPFLLRNDFGLSEAGVARAMAYFFAAGGLGSIVASTVVAQRDLPRRFMTTMYLCEATALSGLLAFGLMRSTWHGVVGGFVLFTLFAVNEIVWMTTMHRLVPRRMLGRVSSVDWFTAISLAPVSFGIVGLVGGWVAPRTGLIVAGVTGAAILVGLMLSPGARDPERRAAPHPTSDVPGLAIQAAVSRTSQATTGVPEAD